jgi:hypothetical protein
MDETIRTEEIGKLFHLRPCALITPDDGGPNYFIVGIQQDCPMHLPRESDAGDFISAGPQGVKSASNRQTAGSPPVVRILFRPSRLRRCEGRVLFCAGRDDSPAFINDESTGSAGADIDPEELDTPSPLQKPFL